MIFCQRGNSSGRNYRRKKCFFGGILLFPWYFEFSEGKVEVFYFFQGKMQNTPEFWLFPQVFTFSSKIPPVLPPKYRGKSEKPEGKLKIPRYFAFSLGKSKKNSTFPSEKSKYWGKSEKPEGKSQKSEVFCIFPWKKWKKPREKPKYQGKSQNTKGKAKYLGKSTFSS